MFDPVRAACKLQDYNVVSCNWRFTFTQLSTCQCVQNLASSTLGSILGTYTLSSLLSAREEIASTVLQVFNVACHPWGVQVERVEVMNLSVAKEMVVSMAVEAKASREANGLIIMQQGEGLCLEKMK